MSELQQVGNRDLNDNDRDRYGDFTHLHSELSMNFQIPGAVLALNSVLKTAIFLYTTYPVL